jgi:hypothetical protein
MEPRGCERHRWAKPRGRNGRERMSQHGKRTSFNRQPRDRDLAEAQPGVIIIERFGRNRRTMINDSAMEVMGPST